MSTRIGSGLVVHGGVGTIPEGRMTPEMAERYRDALREALAVGHLALHGGNAIDGVVGAVRSLEDSPLFNAGRGSNFDERGVITMDAALMRGRDGSAGAVAGVVGVRNPIELAREVMEHSEHVMLIGEGAEAFGRSRGIAETPAEFFETERRRADLRRAKAHGPASRRPNVLGDLVDPQGKTGTVGAVALDRGGDLAAATSTGGMANKTWGRVGDTPLIGAGTWASRLCAVSCTGWGELFIRNASAHDVHARMVHGRATLRDAVHGVIWDVLDRQVPRSGGLIALDHEGNVELCFNTPGMYRGWVNEKGHSWVDIFGGP